MDNYELSNKFETLPNCKLSIKTKALFKSLREQPSVNQNNLQTVADAICSDLNVSKTRIIFGGTQSNTTQNGKLKSKTLGIYYANNANIRVFEFTAMRGKSVAPKTAFDTLLHELCHHFDYKILKLQSSIHSAGFYKRIGYLKSELLS